MKRALLVGLALPLLLVLLLLPVAFPGRRHDATASPGKSLPDGTPAAIHKIRHVVIVMQENRSFDSYFGTFPGADGIPKGVCLPDPLRGGCDRPYHNPKDRNSGGPHDHVDALRDIARGAMDGFVRQAERGRRRFCGLHIDSPVCSLTSE